VRTDVRARQPRLPGPLRPKPWIPSRVVGRSAQEESAQGRHRKTVEEGGSNRRAAARREGDEGSRPAAWCGARPDQAAGCRGRAPAAAPRARAACTETAWRIYVAAGLAPGSGQDRTEDRRARVDGCGAAA